MVNMSVTFHDHEWAESPANGRTFSGAQDAIELLHGLRSRDPFFCSFDGPNGTLLIGVACEYGCVQYTPAGGEPPYLMASGKPKGTAVVEFLSGGTPTPISEQYLLRWPELDGVIRSFVEKGILTDTVSWHDV